MFMILLIFTYIFRENAPGKTKLTRADVFPLKVQASEDGLYIWLWYMNFYVISSRLEKNEIKFTQTKN